MGEQADYLTDSMADQSFTWSRPARFRGKSCRYCLRDGLYWRKINGTRFRLVTMNGDIHDCAQYKSKQNTQNKPTQ